jgi:hypothetical protein
MLTTDSLRSILDAAIGRETDVVGYVDAMTARGLLPADDEPLNARAVAIVALALISGEQPAQAPSAALQLATYCLRGVTQRCNQVGGAMMLWSNLPEVGSSLGETLAGLIEDIAAGTWAAALPIVQARRVRSPSVDVALIEAYARAEGAPMLNGISFAPAVPAPPGAGASPLTRLTEVTLEWFVVEQLALELGQPPAADDPSAELAVAQPAPRPARVLH